jgi:RNA polymerase sigma-70 factor (ECF subfamily)
LASDDRSWFEPLVRSLGNRALRFALMNVGDFETAQDIVQEAFIRCWSSPKTPSNETEFIRWLYRVIVNLARDYHRHQARLGNVPIPPIMPADPMEQFARRAEDREVLAALQTLNLRERQSIYLRYFEDLPFSEVARIMHSPQVSVRVLVHRSLAKLKRQLESETPEEAAI